MTLAAETSGTGPDLVLIHGVGTNRSVYSRVRPLLEADHRVTVLDLPGFGASRPLEGGFELESVADAIAADLSDRIDGRFDLVGSSLGGAISLLVAVRHPDLIRRLILAAPAGFRSIPGPLATLASVAVGPMLSVRRNLGGRLAGSATARRLMLTGTIADGGALSPDQARTMLDASGGTTRLRQAMRAAAAADLRSELGQLDRPLGLIWGDSDGIVPLDSSDLILELRPGTPVEIIEDAGHIPHFECPEEFRAAAQRLLATLG